MTTYSIFKTLHAPTGIENAVYCNFINEKDQNLITSGTNQLQIYKLNLETPSDPTSKTLINKKLKFELVKSFQLFGIVSGVAKCRYGSMKKDALVIAFSDAKLSIIFYNELTGDLDTLAMHYFEDEIESVNELLFF